MRSFLIFGLAALVVAVLPGCALPDAQPDLSATAPPPTYVTAEALKGEDWVVERLDGIPMVHAPQPRLRWASESQVSGTGGCNQFAGKATLNMDRLTFGPLASTRMLCVPRPQSQEDKFFKALELTRRVRQSEGALILSDEEDKMLLRLVPAPKP